jgi:hypothetical protein
MENEDKNNPIQTDYQNHQVQKQLNINDIVELAKPLIEVYQKAKFEQQKQLLDFELNALEHESKQNKLLVNYLFIIALIILGISIYLFIGNRDSTAMSLMQLVISLGAVAFGAYQWGKNRKTVSATQGED